MKRYPHVGEDYYCQGILSEFEAKSDKSYKENYGSVERVEWDNGKREEWE